jgi:hypothetical protein
VTSSTGVTADGAFRVVGHSTGKSGAAPVTEFEPVGARPDTTTKTAQRGDRQATRGRGTRKLNRSEQQAMRIRAAASAAAARAAADDSPAADARPIRDGDGARLPASKAVRSRAANYGVALSREQEMAFVRADLRRLLWISGILIVCMFVLLALLPN